MHCTKGSRIMKTLLYKFCSIVIRSIMVADVIVMCDICIVAVLEGGPTETVRSTKDAKRHPCVARWLGSSGIAK